MDSVSALCNTPAKYLEVPAVQFTLVISQGQCTTVSDHISDLTILPFCFSFAESFSNLNLSSANFMILEI